MWLLMSIYEVLTAFILQYSHDYLVADLKMNSVAIVHQAITGTSLGYLPIQATDSQIIDVYTHSQLWLPRIYNQ